MDVIFVVFKRRRGVMSGISRAEKLRGPHPCGQRGRRKNKDASRAPLPSGETEKNAKNLLLCGGDETKLVLNLFHFNSDWNQTESVRKWSARLISLNSIITYYRKNGKTHALNLQLNNSSTC